MQRGCIGLHGDGAPIALLGLVESALLRLNGTETRQRVDMSRVDAKRFLVVNLRLGKTLLQSADVAQRAMERGPIGRKRKRTARAVLRRRELPQPEVDQRPQAQCLGVIGRRGEHRIAAPRRGGKVMRVEGTQRRVVVRSGGFDGLRNSGRSR